MRIGIFGGTFDPPHLGHLVLATEAIKQLSLDKLLFVLTPDPPHKTESKKSPLKARLAMLKAAINNLPMFEISSVEMDRPGPHYTVDTVGLLRKEFPADELVYLMGGDSMKNLLVDWHNPIEYINACDEIAVMRRPQDDLDLENIYKHVPELIKKLVIVDAPLVDISSRQIRKDISEGIPDQNHLPKTVWDVIQELGLFKSI